MERAYFDAKTRRLVARADRRDADSLGRRRLARAARHARREPLLPARASATSPQVAAGPHVGRRARRGRRPDDRDGRSRTRRTFAASVLGRRALTPLDLEREFGLDRRRHLPRRADARPALLRAAGARPRRLPDAGARALSVRRGDASGRRRDRRSRTQRGARDPARRAAPWPLKGRRAARRLGARIAALGVAQIISWGTLFYTIAVLGAPMRAELGVGDMLLFGAFSAGLFVSGAASPAVGRLDRRGTSREARSRRARASARSRSRVLALAQGPRHALSPAGSSRASRWRSRLYDPAFAALHHDQRHALPPRGHRAHAVRRLREHRVLAGCRSGSRRPVGWRATFGVYAALHIVVCLPLHLVRDTARRTPTCDAGACRRRRRTSRRHRRPSSATFGWLALALAGRAFIASARVGAPDRSHDDGGTSRRATRC